MIPIPVALLACALLLQTSEATCPSDRPTKQLLCYVERINDKFDPCLCTHLVLQTPLDKLTPQSELLKTAQALQLKNPHLKLLAVASDLAETALKRRDSYAKSISSVVDKCSLDGVEVDLQWGAKVAGKVQLVDLVQSLSKEFKSLEPKTRTKRDYKIYEKFDGDVTTPQWIPSKRKIISRESRSTDENEKESKDEEKKEVKNEETEEKLIIVRLTSEPQHLAKNFDLKRLSKYVDMYTISSDNLTDASENGVAYHPSRLMGIQDILNADSLIDLLTGLGAPHEKLVLTMPATALKFTLQDPKKNLPQSPVVGQPQRITQSELCATMSDGNWTVERDEDLTAPYAFHNTSWIAFDDQISASIKGKYILLRDLAGGAIMSADAEDWTNKCNTTRPAILATLYDTFTNIARKSRAAQLISLQEELHESAQYSYSGDIHLSPYRIVRVVDRAGSIHVVRKEAKTEFECSRQGYFTHPSGCNRFYRCVKFNQYTPDFTVFEYDCPAGLAFDERYEVCVWPGSLPDGGACQGSSEIAPVPRGRYVCPRVEGYYADPENCRWFFACLDHVRDGVTPLTAYEFRCPFGLVFNEKALVCDWPWLVEGCGGVGAFSASFSVGDFYEGRQRASYASLSDVHVSGGRIENVQGGLVLDSAVLGGFKGGYASGSSIHESGGSGLYLGGAYGGKGYAGEGHSYSGSSGSSHGGGVFGAGGHGGAYSAGAHGGAYSAGAHGGGAYSAGEHGEGAYSAVEHGGGAYSAGAHGGGAYSAGEHGGGAYSAGEHGEGVYSAGVHAGGAYSAGEHGGSVYNSGSHGGSAGSYSAGSGYSGGQYVAAGHGGAYTGTEGAGLYVDGGAYSGQSGSYSGSLKGIGFESGHYGGSAGRYESGSGYGVGLGYGGAVGSTSGGKQYSGSSYEAGKYAGGHVAYGAGDAVHSGGYVAGGSSSYSGGAYTHGGGGDYVALAVDDGKYQGHSGASKGAFSSSSFTSQSGGAGTYQAPSYGLAGGYDAGLLSTYHGGYGQKEISLKTPSVPVTLVSDAISSGYKSHDLSGLHVVTEHKPAVNFVNLEAVKVTPGSDAVSNYGVSHYYEHSTASPLPAGSVTPSTVSVSTYDVPLVKTVTQSPISISSYETPIVYQSSPRPTTYYQAPSLAVTPAVTYQRPLVSLSTPAPAISVTPSPLPAFQVHTYEQPAVKAVTPIPSINYHVTSAPIVKVPTVFKTPVVPLKPIQYSTPSPVTFGYSSPAPLYPSTPAPAISSVEYSYPRPAIGVVKTPLVPYSPVSYSFKQPTYSISTPAPPVIKTVSQAPLIYQEGYSYQKQLPVQPVQPLYQKVQPVQPLYQKVQPVQPLSPALSYTYTYNKPAEVKVPVAVTPGPIAVDYSPSPATIVKPLEVKYAYPKPAVLKTPIVPLNPIQYSTPASYSYSAPVKSYQSQYTYEQSLPAVQVKAEVPVQYSTLAPVQYSTPAPVQYSTPAPIQYSTPAPVSYSPSPSLFVKPYVPTVLKTPVVPLNPVQYTTASPVYSVHSSPSPHYPSSDLSSVISSVKFGHGYKAQTVQPIDYSYQQSVDYHQPVQQIEVSYNYPKPAVKLVQPVVSTTPATVYSVTPSPIPMYQKVINAFKAPVVSAYQKVLNVISSTPASLPLQPVTQSPVTYAPVDVGYSYRKPVLVKTPSIPVTPVNVVPAYQKVLNVIKASTTPAPLYVNQYSSYETPQVVSVTTPRPVTYSTGKPNVVSESSFGLDLSNHGFEGNTDEFYEAVRQDFGKFSSGSYQQEFGGYDYPKPANKFIEGVDIKVPLQSDVKYYTSTPAVLTETYSYSKPSKVESYVPSYNFESEKVSGYSFVSTPAPVTKFVSRPVSQYSGGHVGVEYGGSVGYAQLPAVTSTTAAPLITENLQPIVKEQVYSGHVGVEYDGSLGYAQLPVVTSTTAEPTVKVTTARVSLPVVTSPRPIDYTRRKIARVRPVVVTTENYPVTYKSSYTPSTTFAPTYYSTTPAPFYSSTTTGYESDELDVEGEEGDDSAKLLEAYDGQFGGVLNKVSVSGYSGESSTVANIKDGEAIVGVLKKGRVDYTGRRTKSKVVVVSRLSDFNPILVGKLGAECSCTPKSKTLTLRRRGKTQLFTPQGYDYQESQNIPDQALTDTYVTSTTTLSPEALSNNIYNEYESLHGNVVSDAPIVEIKPLPGRKVSYTTVAPTLDPAFITADVQPSYEPSIRLSPNKFRKTVQTKNVYSDASVRPTYQEVLTVSAGAGKSFDRYGPGGLRGVDETLQGSVDCKRAGLFRHPKYCNKFYACNWDQWKQRFTLHVFNCPVHLAYDSGLGACNWPSKGPACADDNLLV